MTYRQLEQILAGMLLERAKSKTIWSSEVVGGYSYGTQIFEMDRYCVGKPGWADRTGLPHLYIIGTAKWSRLHGKYDVPVETVSIPRDEASIARGEHIATIHMCGYCHTETLSGQSETVPGLITLTFPNLTAGGGGVGATNTDEAWVRAIRHGVGRDGRGLMIMPSRFFYYLSDEDLGALIAYLKTLPPVDNEMPSLTLGPLGRLTLGFGRHRSIRRMSLRLPTIIHARSRLSRVSQKSMANI